MEKEQEVKKPRLLSDQIRDRVNECNVKLEEKGIQKDLQEMGQEIRDSYKETDDVYTQSKYNFELYTNSYDFADINRIINNKNIMKNRLFFIKQIIIAQSNLQDPNYKSTYDACICLAIDCVLGGIIINDNYEIEKARLLNFINNSMYLYFPSLYKKLKALKINIELQPKLQKIDNEYQESLNKIKVLVANSTDKSDEEKRKIYALYKTDLDNKTELKREESKNEYLNKVDSKENIKGKIDYDKLVQMRNEIAKFYKDITNEIAHIRSMLDANISTERRKLLISFQSYYKSFMELSKWLDTLTPEKMSKVKEEIVFKVNEQNDAIKYFVPTSYEQKNVDTYRIVLDKYQNLSEQDFNFRKKCNNQILSYNLVAFKSGRLRIEDFLEKTDDDLLDIFLINGEVRKPKEESNQSVK